MHRSSHLSSERGHDSRRILEDEVRNFRARFSGEVKRRKIQSVTFVSKDTGRVIIAG